jgi:predicted nucleotidyltransferase/biotin operon repressor
MTKQHIRVCIDLNPAGDSEIFRGSVADDILRVVADAHEDEFTINELTAATGASRSTVWRALNLLESLGVITVRETPQRNYISIDPDRLRKDDPVLAIEQSEFHAPVRAFLDEVRAEFRDSDAVSRLVGVVVFGSVARGEADRQSDIDVLVVVEGDRTAGRRCVADVVAALRDRRFDGDRYEFEQYVESVETAQRAGDKLAEIFAEGITVYDDDELGRLIVITSSRSGIDRTTACGRTGKQSH